MLVMVVVPSESEMRCGDVRHISRLAVAERNMFVFFGLLQQSGARIIPAVGKHGPGASRPRSGREFAGQASAVVRARSNTTPYR